jgi:hypothetical protein
MNDETESDNQQTAPAGIPLAEPAQVRPQAPDPRQRLRQLLAIPERGRTDAMWDEIVELEIQMAPANRAQPQQNNANKPAQQRPQESAPRPGGKRFNNKRRRGPGKP